MTLRDRINQQVKTATDKHAADSAATQTAMKQMNQQREQEALSTAIALLDDAIIEKMIQQTLAKQPLARNAAFGITNRTLQAVRLENNTIRPIEGLGFDFPYDPDPVLFRKALTEGIVRDRIAALAAEGLKIDFPNLQLGSKPVIMVDFRNT